jgi:hypothetical protein
MDSIAAKTQLPSPRRSWLRFSLRTFFVLLTIFGVWLGIKINAARRQHEAVEAVRKMGGGVGYDYQIATPVSFSNGLEFDENKPPPAPKWLRDLLGVDFFSTVVGVEFQNAAINDKTLESVVGLPKLQSVKFDNAHIDPKNSARLDLVANPGIAAFAKLEHLQCVLYDGDLSGNSWSLVLPFGHLRELIICHKQPGGGKAHFDNHAMEQIGKLGSLEKLIIVGFDLTDMDVKNLQNLSNLQELTMDGNISDHALTYLAGLKKLRYLNVSGTQISNAGIAELQKSLPTDLVWRN